MFSYISKMIADSKYQMRKRKEVHRGTFQGYIDDTTKSCILLSSALHIPPTIIDILKCVE